MQSNRTTPTRGAGTGSAIILLLLGILLLAAALYLCFSILRPQIETDLTARVTESLTEIGLKDENIKVAGQDVMLAGVVDSDLTRQKAQVRASSIYGVARVYNHLRLDGEVPTTKSDDQPDNQPNEPAARNPSDSTSEDFTASVDNSAATQTATPSETTDSGVANDLVLDETLSPSTLDITVAEGQVNVQGIVPSEASIEKIIAALAGKFGAANVEDDMSTYVGSAKPRWLDGTIEFIDQIDNVDNPFIRITHSGATVGGTVTSDEAGRQKTDLAERLLGNYLDVKSSFTAIDPSTAIQTQEIKKRAVILRPATLTISEEEGLAVISGVVNSDREAQAIRDGASNLFSEDFEDRLVIDESVAQASWIAEAIAITNNVRNVDNFSVSVNSGELVLNGDVTDRISGRSLASAAIDIAGNKLNVVNNFSPTIDGPIVISGEELLANELQNELKSLNTAAIVFKKGSTELTDEAKLVLNDVADVIMNYRNQVVEIAGHTDTSGDALTNLELSRKRAIAVQEYLVDRQVPAARLRPIGYGETNPITENLTPEGQAANRRIEFKL